tara:strand:+ start:10253 stop:10612 length:360 start_codon:yes stop_codon:yes gene_type:complete
MATLADFRIRLPEFDDVIDARVQIFLDDAAVIMNSPGKWVEFYDPAQIYLAAHWLHAGLRTEAGDAGVLAPVAHKETNDVVIKRAVGTASVDASDFTSTSYGKRYTFYRDIMFAGPVGI